MNKIKKCPFCKGSANIIEEKLWSKNGRGYYNKYRYYVYCNNSKCKINPKTREYNTIYGKTRDECIDMAINDWNKRG